MNEGFEIFFIYPERERKPFISLASPLPVCTRVPPLPLWKSELTRRFFTALWLVALKRPRIFEVPGLLYWVAFVNVFDWEKSRAA